ncbi:MAG: hypothetical protein OK456_09560 [Thaumarchaeota archaeon]|nr:hypothetical protein [Nitrososphaerota archaeon]
MKTAKKARYLSRMALLTSVIALLLFTAKLGNFNNEISVAAATTPSPTMPVGRGKVDHASPSIPVQLAPTPQVVEFVGDAWTLGTAQPGDTGALLNVTIADESTQFELFSVSEVLHLNAAHSCLQGTVVDASATGFVNGTMDPGSEGVATFPLNLLPSQPGGGPCQSPVFVDDTVTYFEIGAKKFNSSTLSISIPITIPQSLNVVGSHWSSPSGGAGGYQGDEGDTLTLDIENPNPFPVYDLGASILTSSALSSPDGSSSIPSNPAPQEVIQPNGIGILNFSADIPANAPLGSGSQSVSLTYLDQWSHELNSSVSFNVNIDGRGDPTLTTVLNNVTLGSSSPVSFVLNNAGTGGIYSPSIAIQVASPLILVSNSVTSSSQEIPPGGALPVKAVVSTGPTTGPGTYPGTITVTYFDQFQVSHTLVFSVAFIVIGSIQTSISITTLTNTVTVGTTSTVSFDVNNIGNASMFDPTFTLQVSSPIVIAANSSLSSTVPIQPGNFTEFDVSVTAGPAAADGAYPGAIVVTYTDASGGIHNQTVPVGFTVVGTVQTYVQVGTLQNEVNIGAESTVAFAISNVGTQNMSSPTFTLAVSTPLVVVANSTFSSTTQIPPGGDLIFSATITCGPSAVGGDYPGTITVTYVDKIGATHSLTFAVGFLVSGSTRTSVAVSTVNNEIAIGSTSTVSFLISNVGSQPMQAPSFSLQVASPLVITSNSSMSMTSPILPGSSAVFESNVTAGPSVAPGAYAGSVTVTYTDEFGVAYSQTFSVGFLASGSTQTLITVTNVDNTVQVGTVSKVAFDITNTGDAPMNSPTVTLQVLSPIVIVANSTLSSNETLGPQDSLMFFSQVTTGPNVAGGEYAATLVVSYLDQFGAPHTESFAVGLTVSGSTLTSVSVSTLANTVAVGASASVSFQIANIGAQPMYSPMLTLVVSDPLEVTANSTFTTSSTLASGQTLTFTTQITDGPGTPIRAYSGTLMVSYADKFGAIHTQNFTVGFLVVGTVHLVLLDQKVVQNPDNLTVSGTILNDGTATALYVNVTVSVMEGQGLPLTTVSQYVGAVSPTTPIPFSILVPYQSQDQVVNGSVILGASYQDNYRQPAKYNTTIPVTLVPSSQLPETIAALHRAATRKEEVTVAEVGGVVAVAIAAAWFILRRRTSLATPAG